MEGFTLLEQPTLWQNWLSFWAFEDKNALWVLMGSLLLGMSASVIGAFAFLRKRALIGDALAHSALPGVMAAFLLFATRDPIIMFVGAMISSLIGFYLMDWLPKNTKIKPDASLAITLSFFFAIGLMLLSYIQGLQVDNKSGLDKILFGQAAAMTESDVRLLLYVSIFVLVMVALLFQKFRLIAFNRPYAQTLGVPIRRYELFLAMLIVMTVVVGLQLVGVVLMAAILLTPMAAARFWSGNLAVILWVSAIIGSLSALLSIQVSYLSPAMPTGPWMVVSLTVLFFISMLFAPYKGILQRFRQQHQLRRQIGEENILRTLFKLAEKAQFKQFFFLSSDIQRQRSMKVSHLKQTLLRLQKKGLLQLNQQGIQFTQNGFSLAVQLTRRHRLWENYLTENTNLTKEQVHNQAEHIEHILSEAEEQQLQAELYDCQNDPHGNAIPCQKSLQYKQELPHD